ncbi:uncharacterized protein LOC108481927 [Gossypium arboreum]|uniref:uncharacterized protein LOC108481927 n=1 Tax=Gossypium arboreum TaxID=29729 RepID=UPI0022F18E23|nr:uncharacterized protein LOC108481927 [Gossypium arboreum]
MRKSSDGEKDALQRRIVYSYGDHYYFRKELKILNLITGYIFLLDKFGIIRWQGFGLAKYFRLPWSSLVLTLKACWLNRMNKFTVLRDLNFVAENLGVEFFKERTSRGLE